jgi:FkbM family methyltransferase
LLRHQQVGLILDVGGNKGQSVEEYRKLFQDARILSFEPFEETYNILSQKCEEDGNATAIKLAVSDEIGQQAFFVTSNSTMHSLLPLIGAEEQLQEKEVETITLDTFCRRERISRVPILKMDIQGGELQALRGAAGLLADRRIDVIYTEIMFSPQYHNQAQFFELYQHVHQFGYHLFGLYGLRINQRHVLQHGNAIFISSEIEGRLAKQCA